MKAVLRRIEGKSFANVGLRLQNGKIHLAAENKATGYSIVRAVRSQLSKQSDRHYVDFLPIDDTASVLHK